MSELAVGQLKGLLANSNKITVPSGHTLYAPGNVIQVVQGVLTTPVVFTTQGSWTELGISASITPKSTTSKILISAHVQLGSVGSSYDGGIGLFKNGSEMYLPTSIGSRLNTFMPFIDRNQSLYEMTSVSNSYLDSPATTSALTYSLRAYQTNTNAHYINRTGSDADGIGDNRTISTITLMEVAA